MRREKFFQHLLKFRYAIIIICLAVTAGAAFFLQQLKTDNFLEIWYESDAPELVQYRHFKNNFTNDFKVIVFYQSEDLFSKKELLFNKKLIERFNTLPNVSKAMGLYNFETISIRKGKLVKRRMIPRSGEISKWYKEQLSKHPLLSDHVISKDATVHLIAIEPKNSDDESNTILIDDINKILTSQEFSSTRFHVTGYLPFNVELNRVSNYESEFFTTICLLIIFVLLWLIFKSWKLSLATLSVAAFSSLWTMGIYAASNSMNFVTGMMPSIILVVSVAGSVHIIFKYKSRREEKNIETLAKVLADLLTPCFYTSLTTATAFLAFLSSSIPPLQSFGLFAAFGVSISFILIFTLLPALLSLMPLKEKAPLKPGKDKTLIDKLPHWIYQHKGLILIISIATIIFSISGLQYIKYETDSLKYLKPSNPARKASDKLQSHFNGLLTMEIYLTSPEKNYFQTKNNLEKLRQIEKVISQVPEITKVFSMVHFTDEYIRNLKSQIPIPLTTAMMNSGIQQAIGLEPNSLKEFISEQGEARITVRYQQVSHEKIIEIIQTLEKELQPVLEKNNLEITFTGSMILAANLYANLKESQINSILFSFSLIFAMMLFLTRSFYLGLLAMIPNVIPVVLTLGIIGWSGTRLDVATILIAAISMGLAVDDTIHLLYNFIQKRKAAIDINSSLLKSIHQVGNPLSITSFVLIGGFSVLIFSEFTPVIHFGIFISLNVFFALVCDLVVLPALLMRKSQTKK